MTDPNMTCYNNKLVLRRYSYGKEKSVILWILLLLTSLHRCDSAVTNNNTSTNETSVTTPEKVVTVSNLTLYVNAPGAVFVCRNICSCRYSSVSCKTPDTLKEIPLMLYDWQTSNVTQL